MPDFALPRAFAFLPSLRIIAISWLRGSIRCATKLQPRSDRPLPLHRAASHILGRARVHLPDTGQNGIPLALVLIAKFLTVSLFLLPRPDAHLTHCNDNEKDSAQTPIDECNANPCNCLKQVVGAGHKIEAKTLWDTPFGAAGTTQVLEGQVRAEVADLTNCE